ncbi:MAG: LOG family protein [Ignavibacteriales bacterium]|nr:MAG: LOG family protein [Ignavibacteriales bacterium]
MRYITLFGSSLPSEGDEQYTIAYETGRRIAEAGFGVCSGGNKGIMEAASRGAVEAGGEALGITVSAFPNSNPYLTSKIECPSLFERITRLIEYGDAYIILQGGTGTLLELSAVWELINKGLLPRKPAAAHSPLWSNIIPLMEEQIIREGRLTGLVRTFDDHRAMTEYILGEL